jgi:predicted DNA-binding transcriptional regulator AlpA
MRIFSTPSHGSESRGSPKSAQASQSSPAISYSMRSGWTSTAAKNGARLWKMKEISRHKSTDVLAGYIREAELFQQHASVGMYTRRALADNRPVPRRRLSRDEAAIYIGVSPTTFDKLVADRRMPQPRRIDGRKVWDIQALDLHFDMLPIHGGASQSSSWADA